LETPNLESKTVQVVDHLYYALSTRSWVILRSRCF
jgi:hypothetical protein